MTLDERLRAAQDDLDGPDLAVHDSKRFVRSRTRRRYGSLGVAAVLLLGAVALPAALRQEEPTQVFSGDVRDLLLPAGELPGDWQRSSTGDTIAMSEGPCAAELDRPHQERADRGFVTPPITASSTTDLLSLTYLAQRVTRYGSVADADAAFDHIAEVFDRCRDQDVANPGGGRTRGQMAPLDLDLDADEDVAVSADLVVSDADGEESPASAQLVVFRMGDAVVLLMQANYQEELPPGIEQIAEAAVARFRR